MKKRQLLKKIQERNNPQYNLDKLGEELNELCLVISQLRTKPARVDVQELIDELGDVYIRVLIASFQIGEKKVRKRINKKLKKYTRYLKEDTYANI